MSTADLAQNVETDPERVRETTIYYKALVETMNATFGRDGTQDALCVFEAIALLLAQLTAGVDDPAARGILRYVQERAETHRSSFAKAGKAAKHFVGDLN